MKDSLWYLFLWIRTLKLLKLSVQRLDILDDLLNIDNAYFDGMVKQIYASGVDFTKGFKTWHKFSTEIRFVLIPIIILFIAHEFITGKFWHNR